MNFSAGFSTQLSRGIGQSLRLSGARFLLVAVGLALSRLWVPHRHGCWGACCSRLGKRHEDYQEHLIQSNFKAFLNPFWNMAEYK